MSPLMLSYSRLLHMASFVYASSEPPFYNIWARPRMMLHHKRRPCKGRLTKDKDSLFASSPTSFLPLCSSIYRYFWL
jgi:hypothetical protein